MARLKISRYTYVFDGEDGDFIVRCVETALVKVLIGQRATILEGVRDDATLMPRNLIFTVVTPIQFFYNLDEIEQEDLKLADELGTALADEALKTGRLSIRLMLYILRHFDEVLPEMTLDDGS